LLAKKTWSKKKALTEVNALFQMLESWLVASASATVAPATTAAATAVTAATTSAAVAAAATTVTAAAATATTTAAAGGPRFTGSGFVHSQRTTFDSLPVEFCNGGLSIRFRTHRDESKAARLAGEFILHERDFRDRSGLRKKLLQFVFRRIEGKIAYV
jgi:hypothetical protein